MELQAITTLIGTMGFPIVACLCMGWYVKYMSDQHKEEIGKVTEALNNNTLVLSKLCEKMDADEVGGI